MTEPYVWTGPEILSDEQYEAKAREIWSDSRSWQAKSPEEQDRDVAEMAKRLRELDERGYDPTPAWRHVARHWIIAVTDEGDTYPIGVQLDTGIDCSGRPDWSGSQMAPGHDLSERVRVTNKYGYTLAFGRGQIADSPEADQPDGHWTEHCPLCRLTFKTDAWTARCLSCGTALNSVSERAT
jgi:hypothetical protein